MQLLQGSIRYTVHSGYIAKVRTRLGLAPPRDSGIPLPADQIVLLPDGFCLTGALHLPWLAGADPVSGWFKVGFRKLIPTRDKSDPLQLSQSSDEVGLCPVGMGQCHPGLV